MLQEGEMLERSEAQLPSPTLNQVQAPPIPRVSDNNTFRLNEVFHE